MHVSIKCPSSFSDISGSGAYFVKKETILNLTKGCMYDFDRRQVCHLGEISGEEW